MDRLVANPEAHSQVNRPDRPHVLFRVADGPALQEFCGEVAVQLAGLEQARVFMAGPTGKDACETPLVKLISYFDMRQNKYALRPDFLERPVVQERLIETVPSLRKSMPIAVRGVQIRKRSNNREINLAFTNESWQRIHAEHEAVWATLAKLTGFNRDRLTVPSPLRHLLVAQVPVAYLSADEGDQLRNRLRKPGSFRLLQADFPPSQDS